MATALSGSYQSSLMIKEQLASKYPQAKIVCIDSLNSCMGLGLMCIMASELRLQGKTIEETAKWVEDNKLKINQECSVESLKYLKQAGRVSALSAFFGGLLSVKPIIVSDVNGMNVAIEKVKGRMTSIDTIVQRSANEYTGEWNKVAVVHADCEMDHNVLVDKGKSILPKDVEVITGTIGPIIGASAGPGTIAVYLLGKEVTFDSRNK